MILLFFCFLVFFKKDSIKQITKKKKKETSKQELFETLPIPKAVKYLAIPTIISQLITIIYNWADTFFVGQLNDTRMIAAVTICHPSFMMTTAIANLVGVGGASAISRALGSKMPNKARKISVCSFFLGILISLTYSILLFAFRTPLLKIFGSTSGTESFARSYLFYVVILGSIPTVLSSTLGHLVRSVGMSKESSFGLTLGGILNIILDPIFIYVFKLGVTGAAIATLLSNIISTMYFIILIVRKKNSCIISINPKHLKEEYKVFSDIFLSGISSFLLTMLAVISNIAINKLLSNVTDAAISGVSIAKKVDLCVVAISQGLAHGILPLVGYNYASKNYARMKKTINFSATILVIFSLLCVLTFSTIPKPLVSIFIKDSETIMYASKFLRILCLSMPLTSLIFIGNTIFQATKQTGRALTLILIRKGTVDIPLMIILDKLIPVYGVIISQPIVDSVAGIVAIVLYILFIVKINKLQKNELSYNV